MDNRVFNVNGTGDELLLQTLKLAFAQEGRNTTANAWRETKKHGLILCWTIPDSSPENYNQFPSELTAEEVFPAVKKYLEKAEDIEMKDWDANADHDGSNELGWRVYCEDWGHVDDDFYAIVAIKPAYMWYGK